MINRGSTTLKVSLYEFPKLLWETKVENGEFARLIPSLPFLSEVDAIGHRIVHGGREFRQSVLIDKTVKEKIRQLAELAPLHNRADLEAIELMEKILVGKPQVAVFDTAFHRTMPESAIVYPGPYRWYEKGIQRFGFHGISFQYCTHKLSENYDVKNAKILICHLGSGASLCAIKEGKSIDTTMGFSPLEGLMMDTRSGSVDPGILLHLLKGQSLESLGSELNEGSGLLGLSGLSSDMRVIIEKAAEGHKRAKLALEVYIHRLNRSIGEMIASLGGLDLLVFTAGIGENAPLIRKRACENLRFLGLSLDGRKNEAPGDQDTELSAKDSKVKVVLIHTKEAYEIAKESLTCISRA